MLNMLQSIPDCFKVEVNLYVHARHEIQINVQLVKALSGFVLGYCIVIIYHLLNVTI